MISINGHNFDRRDLALRSAPWWWSGRRKRAWAEAKERHHRAAMVPIGGGGERSRDLGAPYSDGGYVPASYGWDGGSCSSGSDSSSSSDGGSCGGGE